MWFANYFHLQVLALELLFCLRLRRRERFLLRFLPLTALYCALPLLIPGGFFFPGFVVGWFTFGFVIMFVLSELLIWFCFRMDLRQAVFYSCVAHTLQHIVHCLYRACELAFSLPSAAGQTLQLVFMAAALWVSWRYLRNHFREAETESLRSAPLRLFAVASTLAIYVLSYWTTTMERDTVGVELFDLLACMLTLFILLDIFRLRRAEREQYLMEQLLKQEQEQHRMSRAAIDVINRKCHDLRHQIVALRSMGEEDRTRSIGELEEAVLLYDRFPKCGNENVDLILAEKSMLAEEKQVSLRYVADGAGLSFLRTEDLYSLLGNALDNAIEAAGREEEGRRIITLFAGPRGGLFVIHVENPCSRQPVFLDGMPRTDKPDRDYHGFGMRSMRYLCEKYGGELAASWEDGIFSLDMIFPAGERPPT